MPVPPPCTTFICSNCHWQKTVVFKSDAITLGHNWFDVCPKCGGALEKRPATMIETGLSKLTNLFVR